MLNILLSLDDDWQTTLRNEFTNYMNSPKQVQIQDIVDFLTNRQQPLEDLDFKDEVITNEIAKINSLISGDDQQLHLDDNPLQYLTILAGLGSYQECEMFIL